MSLYTNRCVMFVVGKDKFRNWLLKVNGVAPSLNFLAESKGCYLVDRFVDDSQKNTVLNNVFTSVFRSELSEYVADETKWPDVEVLEVFSDFFTVELCPLIADFGSGSLEQSSL